MIGGSGVGSGFPVHPRLSLRVINAYEADQCLGSCISLGGLVKVNL